MSDHGSSPSAIPGQSAAALIARLEAGLLSNALDVLIEVALFMPDEDVFDAVPNAAGTKVIYAKRDGSFATHWAPDWSLNPEKAIAALRAVANSASPAMPEGLSDLIATLEKAEAGSRELDRAIWVEMVLSRTPDWYRRHPAGGWEKNVMAGLPGAEPDWRSLGPYDEPAPYTTSLDAALALAERVTGDWTAWEIRSRSRKTRFAATLSRNGVTGEDYESGHAKTPALALCIAILRARVANTPTPSHGRDEAEE